MDKYIIYRNDYGFSFGQGTAVKGTSCKVCQIFVKMVAHVRNELMAETATTA